MLTLLVFNVESDISHDVIMQPINITEISFLCNFAFTFVQDGRPIVLV